MYPRSSQSRPHITLPGAFLDLQLIANSVRQICSFTRAITTTTELNLGTFWLLLLLPPIIIITIIIIIRH